MHVANICSIIKCGYFMNRDLLIVIKLLLQLLRKNDNFYYIFSYSIRDFSQIKFHPEVIFYSSHPGMRFTCKQNYFHPRKCFIPG